MKIKFLFLFLIALLSINLVSSVEIGIEDNFSLGENFIAEVSGSFYNPLTKSNIHFYRNQVQTSFGAYSLNNIDGKYYISFGIPIEKIPGNYSIVLEDIKYYVGNQLVEEDVEKEFMIKDSTTFASISPALSIPEEYNYELTLTNLRPASIQVSYGLEGTAKNETSLVSGETKLLTLKTFGGNKFETILFTSGDETYSALVYSQLEEIPIENPEIIEEENQTEENQTNPEEPGFWESIFGGDEEEEENSDVGGENNETGTNTPNNSGGSEQEVCEEYEFPYCQSDEECDGKLVDSSGGQCCDGECVAKEKSSSSWKTIGWILIGILGVFLIWFFKSKYSKTRSGPLKLFGRKK